MELRTILLTGNADRIGYLSCNPAVGGLGKGHMVREIDALGGCMGRWADEASIQARILNAGRGPAVRATRIQVDRAAYMAAVKRDILSHPLIYVRQDTAEAVLTRNGRACGIRTGLGQVLEAAHILIAAGTFLRGRVHIGPIHFPAGRLGDAPAQGLSRCLLDLGFTLRRFMTCTTPRLLTSSIDFSLMEPQPGESPAPRFSRRGPGPQLPPEVCYLTWTNARTHGIIARALRRSPMYNGDIPGAGPRYCPAIEDKIARFPDRERHQVFVEPEGSRSSETYPNNIPTGLPLDVQLDLLHTIPGLERCHLIRPGYAIEYDMLPPTQLAPTLESKQVPGLWFAGQVNGTSGYEEAAAQGLWAAMNIAAAAKGQMPFAPGRDSAYISVLVDDLVTRGTDEPYRMFTSRAEYRLLLREGSAEVRLTPLGRERGLVTDEQWDIFVRRESLRSKLAEQLEAVRISPDPSVRDLFASFGLSPPAEAQSLARLLRRPDMTGDVLTRIWPDVERYPADILHEVETGLRYAGYVERQEHLARRLRGLEAVRLPPDLDYASVAGLTTEVREKLSAIRPATLGQAGRIPGITPAALNCLEIQIRKNAPGIV
jgi:tRNA uridine 5-carboxymethylaminomethyl modification enzyme